MSNATAWTDRSQFDRKQHDPDRDERYIGTVQVARLLGVTPNALRAWEPRYGFPRPQQPPGRRRLFVYAEISALRDALQDGLSVSAAVARASREFRVARGE
jgi:MerR family transcriptional regulator, light-induced transcriptional regulator